MVTPTPTVRCNKCWFHGNDDELELCSDADGPFMGCPVCEDDACLMDIVPSGSPEPLDPCYVSAETLGNAGATEGS